MLPDSSDIARDQNQLEQRSYQTRAFDTTDGEQTMRVVIATLQDLGFVIDQANPGLGVVSGTRLGMRNNMRITVTVRPRGSQVLVRANAQTPSAGAVSAWHYQEFFGALEKSMFLTAHEVD